MAETSTRFQLLELIGRGTLGELYRARDLEHGRTVALRLVEPQFTDDPTARAALFATVNSVAAASHPSLAAVYECGDDDRSVYIASEFVPGQRLSAMINGTPLNARRALDIAAQMADALATAHAHGLVHGALSPGAVLVTPRGIAKVLDTGLAAWTRQGASEPLDDFAAFGAVLFEMLVGRPLKPGWPGELRQPGVSPCTSDVLERLTLAPAQGRFDSMAAVAAALRACADALEPAPTAPPRPVPRAQPRAGSRALPIVVAIAAMLAAAWWFAVR